MDILSFSRQIRHVIQGMPRTIGYRWLLEMKPSSIVELGVQANIIIKTHPDTILCHRLPGSETFPNWSTWNYCWYEAVGT